MTLKKSRRRVSCSVTLCHLAGLMLLRNETRSRNSKALEGVLGDSERHQEVDPDQ